MTIKKITKIPIPKKEINKELTELIEKKIEMGGKIIDIISDLIKFDGYDEYDIIEQIPDYLVTKIRKELAEKNYKIAKGEFPELNNDFLDDFVF